MSLENRVAAVRGGRRRNRLEKEARWEHVGLVILGKEFGFHSRYVAIPFIYFACKKPFKFWIFSRNTSVPEQGTRQGRYLSLSRSCPSPASQSYLSFWTLLQSNLLQDPPQFSHLEPLLRLFAFPFL